MWFGNIFFPDNIKQPTNTAKTMRMSDGGKGEAFQLTQQQQWLIQEDSPNQKLWDEVLKFLKEGPVCFYFILTKVLYCFLLKLCQWTFTGTRTLFSLQLFRKFPTIQNAWGPAESENTIWLICSIFIKIENVFQILYSRPKKKSGLI